MVTPLLDARAKRDGLNVIYHLDDLNLPAIYSSVFANDKLLREHPAIVQKFTAAMAKPFFLSRKGLDKAKASVTQGAGAQRSRICAIRHDAYAKRGWSTARVTVPAWQSPKRSTICVSRRRTVRRKPGEIYDNSFAENLARAASPEALG